MPGIRHPGPGGLLPTTPTDVSGLLIDLDGTVYGPDGLVPGVGPALERLRSAGVPFLFTTNTSRKSRQDVVRGLHELGLETTPEELLTAPVAAAGALEERGADRVLLLLPPSTHADFAGFRLEPSGAGPAPASPAPDAVVVGDLGPGFTFEVLDGAFRALRGGAALVAVHRNRWWLTERGPTLDAGPFVRALEYAADVEALLVGKPAPAFFRLAARALGVPEEGLVVVGDDPESDVRGGRAAGLRTVQVRTGKFDAERAGAGPPEERPHDVIDSLADLPALLGIP